MKKENLDAKSAVTRTKQREKKMPPTKLMVRKKGTLYWQLNEIKMGMKYLQDEMNKIREEINKIKGG